MAEEDGTTRVSDLVLKPGQMVWNTKVLMHFYGLKSEADVATLVSAFGTKRNEKSSFREEVGPGKYKSALFYLYLADKEAEGGSSFPRHHGIREDTETFYTKRIFARKGVHPSVKALAEDGSVTGFIERVPKDDKTQ